MPRQNPPHSVFYIAKMLCHLTRVAWPETTPDICLRVNHHLNMAYTVYHGASSAASLSLCFLPVPPLVSSLIVLIVNACLCCLQLAM